MDGTTDGLTILINGDPSPGRKWFISRLSTVTEDAACQTTIKPDIFGEVCSRKIRLIKMECGWVVITLGNWTVEYGSIGLITPTNNNIIHSMYLSFGVAFVIIGVMIEIVRGERFEPGLGFWSDVMHNFMSCELATKMARYLIEHHSRVPNCIE